MPAGEASGASRAANAMVEAVARVGREVARPAASAVDEAARFPTETIAALRACGALGAAIPRELGGAGLGVGELAESCSALARHCASSGMILAMHHIQIACLAEHRSRELDAYLRRVAAEQRLVASATSEVGTGGDLRSSIAAVELRGTRFALSKRATTVSYGCEADDLLVTARRHPDASAHDQVLVLLLAGEYVLRPTGAWDALGMRGTRSVPATIEGSGASWQILSDPFGDIAAQTMVPVSHVLWASCWLGVASDAVAIARAKLRAEARADDGRLPAATRRLAQTGAKLQLLRNEVRAAASECDRLRAACDRAARGHLGVALRMNNLKLNASQLAVEIAIETLGACGLSGYRNDSPYSVARHLRDLLSAPLMIHGDRLLDANASLWMVGTCDP